MTFFLEAGRFGVFIAISIMTCIGIIAFAAYAVMCAEMIIRRIHGKVRDKKGKKRP